MNTQEIDLSSLRKAILSLEEILKQLYSDFIRDGTIQRFEFTFELTWKALQRQLKILGVRAGNPSDVFRESFQSQLVSAEVLQILRAFIPQRFNAQVFVFGSVASGAATDQSDLDLALKGDEPLPLAGWQELEDAFRNSSIPFKVDLVDFHRVSPSFQKLIDRSGNFVPL